MATSTKGKTNTASGKSAPKKSAASGTGGSKKSASSAKSGSGKTKGSASGSRAKTAAPARDPIAYRGVKAFVLLALALFSLIGCFTGEGLFIEVFREFIMGLVGKGFYFLPPPWPTAP